MRDYAELVQRLRRTFEADELVNQRILLDAADAIEELLARNDKQKMMIRTQSERTKELLAAVPRWISVRDISDEEICAAKMVLSVVENVDHPMLMFDIEKSAVKKALLLMLNICEPEPPKEESK